MSTSAQMHLGLFILGTGHHVAGWRLPNAEAGAENILVMLTATFDVAGLDDWQIWWGANLGTPSERLVAGRVADVADAITNARATAKAASGWVP